VKALVISNMYPSVEKPYAGIFVKNQVNRLRELAGDSLNLDLFAMRRQFTGPVGSFFKYLLSAFRFIPYLFRNYDVVHVHYFFPLYYLAWIYKILHPGSKLLVTFHGSDINQKLSTPIVRSLSRIAIRRCDYVIAVGHELALAIRRRLSCNVDEVLAAGVDRRVFYPEPAAEKKYDFIFVGSFIHRKGVDTVLEILASQDAPWRCCFVGSGHLISEIRRVATTGDIEVRENMSQNEIRMLLNCSRFLLFPSRDEPFGLVVTEALYCGTPAIVTPVGGLVEQVKDGVNGLVAAGTTTEKVAEAVKRAVSMDEENYLAMVSMAEASNAQFSLDAVCGRLLNIYGNR